MKFLAEIAQVLALVLAYYAYTYTIKPAFDKDQMDKEIDARNRDLVRISKQVEAKQDELADASQMLQDKAIQLAEATARSDAMDQRIATLQRRTLQDKLTINDQYRDIRIRLIAELKVQGRANCPLSPETTASFTTCLTELVSSPVFDRWSPADKQIALHSIRSIENTVLTVNFQTESRVVQRTTVWLDDKRRFEKQCPNFQYGASTSSDPCLAAAIAITLKKSDLDGYVKNERERANDTLYETLYVVTATNMQ